MLQQVVFGKKCAAYPQCAKEGKVAAVIPKISDLEKNTVSN